MDKDLLMKKLPIILTALALFMLGIVPPAREANARRDVTESVFSINLQATAASQKFDDMPRDCEGWVIENDGANDIYINPNTASGRPSAGNPATNPTLNVPDYQVRVKAGQAKELFSSKVRRIAYIAPGGNTNFRLEALCHD